LELPAASLRDLYLLLSGDETRRANRFHFGRDRRRYVAGRATLRVLLGRYLDRDPASLRFRYGAHGKPALGSLPGEPDVRFNLAHSEDLALLAFARGREVGVDLERMRPLPVVERIAETAFSCQERAKLKRLAPEQRQAAFYAGWTRKEAYVKARGEGLGLPLGQFDVSLAPGEPAKLIEVRGAPREAGRWTLMALDVAPGYAAALAVEGACDAPRCWQIPTLAN
jgi:4'-phosphopantetheinyl transferase